VELTATTSAEADASVATYLERWLRHIRARVRTVTFEGYESLIRRHALPHVGALALTDVTALRIQELYADLLEAPGGATGLSAGSVLNLHLVLTQAFGQAVRWGLLPANPTAGAQPPRPRRPARIVVDPALLQRLLEVVEGSSLEAPVAVAAATGMRRGEILALRWSDLDADFGAVRVQRTLQPTRTGLVFEQPKTPRSRRTVLLPDFLTPYLERQQVSQAARRANLGPELWLPGDLLIDRGDGGPVNPDTLSTGWARFLRAHKLPPVRFHDLRHAHATMMLTQGVHPKVVSERLGHASIGITLDIYSHVLPTLQQEAAQAFDRLFPNDSSKAA